MSEHNKTAIVTGAGTGIGRAVSLAMLKAGYNVALAGRRSAALEATASTSDAGDRALVAPTDVSQSAEVDALFSKVVTTFGRVDLLFNNAGSFTPAVSIEELTDEQWNSVVSVNLTGAFYCARAAFRQLKSQKPGGGRIINNGSISAHVPRPFSAPYTSTKHAMTGLTRSLALDGRAFNIACGQIDIGNAATEMTAGIAAGVLQANGTRMAEPTIDLRHIADAVLYMANLPLDANVQFMTVMATQMPFIGRG
jgi:NAD(P)-dependent dehydrogenase (short-subunit alcohol dehydrogenase family)